jgi:hypothetical protein
MRLAALAFVLALAGCAAQVISSGPRTVVVRAHGGIGEGQPIAEAECQKHARHARYIGAERGVTQLVFDCVD